MVNYGCYEPLHNNINLVRKLSNVRLISASPWTNVEAEAMGGDFVIARKPNPVFVDFESMDEEVIRGEIRATLNACRRNGTPWFLCARISPPSTAARSVWIAGIRL